MAATLATAAVLAGCVTTDVVEIQFTPSPSPVLLPTQQPTPRPSPTPVVFAALFDPNIDLRDGPVPVPLELHIPSLDIYTVQILGVGLTPANAMDAPKGEIDDAIWHKAFWYRGGGIPGDVGTATIAGHVNDPLGRPEIFAHLQDLHAGDQIIVHDTRSGGNIYFTVDQVKIYTLLQSSDPAVLALIYGAGPVAGIGPQPSPDGLSHLTLITCAGNIANGMFKDHIVVFATRTG